MCIASVYVGELKQLYCDGLARASTQLFYKSGRLRIVVSTANLLEIDWRDIENVRWRLLLDRLVLADFQLERMGTRRFSSVYTYPPRLKGC